MSDLIKMKNNMKSYKEELQEFIDIYDYIDEMHTRLAYHSGMDRDEAYKILYDKAFSDQINGRLQEIFPFDWCDIDAGYDDDFLDWKSGLEDAVRKVRKMLEYE